MGIQRISGFCGEIQIQVKECVLACTGLKNLAHYILF